MNIAIILSGGIGTRMGSDCPKQYIEVKDRPIISWCVETFTSRKDIAKVIIVADNRWISYLTTHAAFDRDKLCFAQPGETRQYSIYNGLKKAKELGFMADDIVIIHDAARPLVSDITISECIAGVEEGYDGVMPALPVKDTTYVSNDGLTISHLLDRSKLRAGQAPESFRLGEYLRLHEEMPREELLKINGSTEMAFKAGKSIKIVDGDERNFKITTPEDLNRFKLIVEG